MARFIACFKVDCKASSSRGEFIMNGSTGFCIRPASPKESQEVKSFMALDSEMTPYLISAVLLVMSAKELKLLRFLRGLE